ncbi:putative transcription factor Hap2/NF-YA family [Lupinus albus]|uniref:Nuclear transcription factor Y subunit n=1 Tax=Lupinus albus TaxID=3870 RepID=A0A6A4MRI9_LUPAL|nr:putative transcription factor Hap2/NF-YA family [Lupinus albus]
MAKQTIYFKEHEGIIHNSLGSQSFYGESCGQMKPFSLEIPNYIDQLASSKESVKRVEQLLYKGNTTSFTIFPDDCKMSGFEHKPHASLSLQSSLAESHNCFELGFSQPMIYAKHPYMDQFCGFFSAHGPQILGRMMLPLNLTSDEEPTYVNAKQYHGIIRRRKSRAKALLENKLRKRNKV